MMQPRSEAMPSPPFDNPFCTRRVRPGAIPFHFPAGDSAEQLLERLRANQWRGALIGPHGSGKSTLLATLEPHLVKNGREIQRLTLRDQQRWMPKAFARHKTLNERTLVIVDGYEQLNYLARLFLGWKCTRPGSGLLVTAHKPIKKMPEVFRTAPSLDLAQLLTRELLSGCDDRIEITAAEIASAFAQHQENLRETLFALYDLYEARKKSSF